MKRIFYISILTTCYFILTTSSVSAEEFSLGVSPSIVTINATQGQTATINLLLENFSEDPATLSVSYSEFTSSEHDNNRIEFIPSSTDFIQFIPNISLNRDGRETKTFEIGAKKKQKLVLTIEIPKEIIDRDFTFTTLFTDITDRINETADGSSFSQISGSIGANILLKIGSNDNETLIIKDFSTPTILQSSPVPFSIQISNPGKSLINPSGDIKIYNAFGQLVGKIDLPRLNILAGKARTYFDIESTKSEVKNISKDIDIYQNVLWNKGFLLGPYTATLDIYLSSGTRFTRSIYFFALPYKSIFVIIFITIILFIIVKRINHHMSS